MKTKISEQMKVNAPSKGHLAEMQNRKSSMIKLDYLTESELAQFEKAGTTPDTSMELHKDMFVFSSHVGGLGISDLSQLRWSFFDGKNINFTRMKTHGHLSIPIPDKGLEILNKYRLQKSNPDAFIFNAICSAPAQINKNVNAIAKLAGIERKINFVVARRTFATMAVKKGIPIEITLKTMGHSDIKQAHLYFESSK